MSKCIMIGCDLHDKDMILKLAKGKEKPVTLHFQNNRSGRKKLLAELKKRSQASRGAKVIFAYEASSQGFGLYDELTDAGHICHVLAPTRMPSSTKQKKNKTDEKDAYSDPHLRARGFFNELPHPVCGTHLYPGLAWRMSRTPNQLRLPPPCLGEHNEYVYKQVIGVTDEEYADLEGKEHIGTCYDASIGFSL